MLEAIKATLKMHAELQSTKRLTAMDTDGDNIELMTTSHGEWKEKLHFVL